MVVAVVTSGRHPEVRFDLGTFHHSGVRVTNLRGVAYDVRAPLTDVLQNHANVRAGRVTVSGTVPRATIDKYAPSGVKIGGNGQRLPASGELNLDRRSGVLAHCAAWAVDAVHPLGSTGVTGAHLRMDSGPS
ncbi:hypothetical protein GCM10023334_088280 [Nonomuraea thailandensis]